MVSESAGGMPSKTPAQKRQETMSRKKLQDQAELRELEASTSKVQRKAMMKALQEPAWKKKRRALSPTTTFEASHATKKKKVISESLKKAKAITMKPQGKKPKASLTRRGPAVIQESDEESSEEQDLDPAIRPKAITNRQGKSKAVTISDDDAENEADDDEKQESDDDEGNSELEKLDTKALKDRLWVERVQWAAGSEDEAEDGHNDKLPKLDLELTSTSEGDLLPDNDNSSGEELTLPSAGWKKPSKRELDRRREVPQWKQSNNDNNDEASIEEVKDEDINRGWRRAIYIPARSGRLISIMAQPVNLQTIIRAAIRRVMGDIIFENTYVSSDEMISYNQRTLFTVADELKEESYALRFMKDHNFVVVVGRVLSGRVSNFRGNIKKITLSKVEGFYQLIGHDCKAKVEQLIRKTSYIFASKEDGTLIRRSKPFHHPAIVSTLRQVLDEGALAEKHDHRFISSINHEPRSNEREMPAALVAAVATAIHSALDDYSTGTCIKTEFNADTYEDVYRGHVTTLTNVRRTNPDGYHRLMADLYNMTLSGGPQRSGTIANNAMELIEFGEMDI